MYIPVLLFNRDLSRQRAIMCFLDNDSGLWDQMGTLVIRSMTIVAYNAYVYPIPGTPAAARLERSWSRAR